MPVKWKERANQYSTIRTRVATQLIEQTIELTKQTNNLSLQIRDILENTPGHALTNICGLSHLGAARIVGEVGTMSRFKSQDAIAKFNGTAPIPVWSSNHPKVRLNKFGNRKLNCVIHIASVTQSQTKLAKDFIKKRREKGNTPKEARRAHKRQLSNIIYCTLRNAEFEFHARRMPMAA